MINFFTFILCFLLSAVTQDSFAQETSVSSDNIQIEQTQKAPQSLTIEKTTKKAPQPQPQVGKHVTANVDASSMILSLLMVLALIIISALVLKRFNLTQKNSNELKVVASLSLGAKERVVVVQVGEQQLVLGVCPQQISLLKHLENPLDIQSSAPLALSGNVLSFLQKNSLKKNSINTNAKSNTTTSETLSNE